MDALDLNAVRERIKQFNEHERWPWEDFVLHELRSEGLPVDRLPALAFAVNYAWRARVDDADLPRLIQHIAQNAPDIIAETAKLRDARTSDPELGRAVGESLLRMLLPGWKKTYAVFAMKFMHWCEPRVLPPLDSKAQEAMNRLGAHIPWPDSTGKWSPDLCATSWRSALAFYNEALSQMSAAEQDALVQFDLDTQPASYQRRNTVVRLLDKYLWLDGLFPRPD